MFTRLRFLVTVIMTVLLSLVFAGGTLSTAKADVNVREPRSASTMDDPSDCGNIFDVWSNSTGKTFIAYYGSSLPASGTVKIYSGSKTVHNGWYVSRSTSYKAEYLGYYRGKWLSVVLKDNSGFTRCEGYYLA